MTERTSRRESIAAWSAKAACLDEGVSPETFFHDGKPGLGDNDEHHAQAIAVCLRCPVKAQCLQHALATPERYGVWGGTTATARQEMLRAIRRAKAQS